MLLAPDSLSTALKGSIDDLIHGLDRNDFQILENILGYFLEILLILSGNKNRLDQTAMGSQQFFRAGRRWATHDHAR